jgi:molybdopterin adenylyltransferase
MCWRKHVGVLATGSMVSGPSGAEGRTGNRPSRQIHGIQQPMAANDLARIGILTVSDRASRGEYEDRGGPAIREYLGEILTSHWEPVAKIVSDDLPVVSGALEELADEEACCLIITTGGTGPALRDVTPEATVAVCTKMMPGFGELMRKVSLEKVPTAILSRQTAGIRGQSLIVNLPGQPKAIRECLDAVFPAIPYCIDLIGGPYLTTDESKIVAFRPKKK